MLGNADSSHIYILKGVNCLLFKVTNCFVHFYMHSSDLNNEVSLYNDKHIDNSSSPKRKIKFCPGVIVFYGGSSYTFLHFC